MQKLINNILNMKVSINQLEYFSTSLTTTIVCLQFTISAILCQIGKNISIEYFTPAIVIICELLLLIFSIHFTLLLEKVVKDRVLSDNVLISFADGYTSTSAESLKDFMKILAQARWTFILIFLVISCLSIVFDVPSCCAASAVIVFILFAKVMLNLLFHNLFERLF